MIDVIWKMKNGELPHSPLPMFLEGGSLETQTYIDSAFVIGIC
jgi:hypothetical protein